MPLAKEDPTGRPNLVVHREPEAPARAGDKGSPGDQALMDALIIVGIAWAVLIFLFLSLRRHNV